MKISIINQHTENWGDEAAFLGFSSALKSLDIQINHIVVNSSHRPSQGYILKSGAIVSPLRYNSLLDKLLALLILKLQFLYPLFIISKKYRKLSKILACSDAVCVGPGGENIGAYKDYFYLFSILMALKLRKKILFAGSSFNQSGDTSFDRISLNLLSKSRVLSRERISRDYLLKNNVNSCLCSDNALYLKKFYDFGVKTSSLDVSSLTGSDPYTVFVPNCLWTWHPRFKDSLSKQYLVSLIDKVFESLSSHGRVIILPQTYPYPNHKEDFSPYEDRFDALILPDLPSLEQINVIANSRAIVGMRYHTVVFAALANTKCFSIAYERKILGFNERFYGAKGLLDITTPSSYDYKFSLPSPEDFPAPNSQLVDAEIANLYSIHSEFFQRI